MELINDRYMNSASRRFLDMSRPWGGETISGAGGAGRADGGDGGDELPCQKELI